MSDPAHFRSPRSEPPEPELRRRLRELEVIYRMTDAISRAQHLGDVYAEALAGLRDAIAADRLSILLFDPDGVLRFKAWRGLSEAYRQAVEGHSPWTPHTLDPAPILVSDARTDPALEGIRQTVLAEGIRGLAFVPLSFRGRVLGKFMVYFDRPHEFAPAEIRLVEMIGRQTAFAIARVRADEALRRRENEAAFLATAGRDLSDSLDVRDTVRSVARIAVRNLAARAAVYSFADDRLQQIAAASRTDESEQAARIGGLLGDEPLDRTTPVWRAVLEQRPIVVDAVSTDTVGTIERGVAIPLIARGRTIGALVLVSGPELPAHEPENVALAVELAARAALALDNALLYQDVERANRSKTQFIATMSHELRTPLNAIVGYADLLEHSIGGRLSDTQRGHVQRVTACATHLRSIIEEALVFARAEAGRENVEIELLDVGQLAVEAAALLEPSIAARGLRFELQRPERAVRVRADARRLRQVLVNLLSNSLKFTDRGRIGVQIVAEREVARIVVSDTGAGIAAEDLDRIFEPFTQVDQSVERRATGSGLGLAVSRRYVELMGGTITVASEPGRGSEFTIRLPREIGAADAPAPFRADIDEPQIAPASM
ncbi:MAG: ATP-binding protein [Longimicrobiales bacterium]